MKLYNEFIVYLQLYKNTEYYFGITDTDEELSDEFYDLLNSMGETHYPEIYVYAIDIGYLMCFQNMEDLNFYKLKYSIQDVTVKDAVQFVLDNNIHNDWEDAEEDYMSMGDNLKKQVLHMLWYNNAIDIFKRLKISCGVTGFLSKGKKYK